MKCGRDVLAAEGGEKHAGLSEQRIFLTSASAAASVFRMFVFCWYFMSKTLLRC